MQADFTYAVAEAGHDPAGLPLVAAVFADRAHVRDALVDDCASAGLRIAQASGIDALLDGGALPLGDVVLLDCPVVDGRILAALARLDLRAAHCGARLVVSTTVAALDDVFACMDQSRPQILVDPGRGERAIALGEALGGLPGARLRELSADDRITLVRLTEQVAQIAARLERMGARGQGEGGGAFRFASPAPDYRAGDSGEGDRLVRRQRATLPDPAMIRQIIQRRQARARYFDAELFADPAWDMLLDLAAARAEGTRVSVTSLCIASGVPPTTALRWIAQMVEAGLFERVADDVDRRRAFIRLGDQAADAMARYFAEVGTGAI